MLPLYVFSCLLASSLPGQSAYKPKLVNSKTGEHHDFPSVCRGNRSAQGWGKGNPRHGRRQGRSSSEGRAHGRRCVMMIEGKTPDVFSKKTDTGLEGPQAL